MQQGVAEAQNGVEPIGRRSAAPRGIMERFGYRRIDQSREALEIADRGRALEAAERVAVARLVERCQRVAQRYQMREQRLTVLGVAARATEQIPVLSLDLGTDQRPGQAQAVGLVCQRAVLP